MQLNDEICRYFYWIGNVSILEKVLKNIYKQLVAENGDKKFCQICVFER